MNKYLVLIGFDHGDAESGPIYHTAKELIEAESEDEVYRKIDNKYGYGRDDEYCGCSVHLATEDEIKKMEEDERIANEEYEALIKAGLIDPEADKDMWDQYEKDELRKDHLLELADQVEGFHKNWINKDDGILIDTRDMSDEEVLKYMTEYLSR